MCFYFLLRVKQTVDISFFSKWLRYYDLHRAYSLHVSPYLFRTIAEYLPVNFFYGYPVYTACAFVCFYPFVCKQHIFPAEYFL